MFYLFRRSHNIHSVTNQSGAALLMAIMILALLTLLGLAATRSAVVELDIARNGTAHNQAFYQAESGWRYAAAYLAAQTPAPREDLGSAASSDSWELAFTPQYAPKPEILTTEDGRPRFAAAVQYDGRHHPVLFSSEVQSLHYTVTARGFGPAGAVAGVEAQVRRLISAPGY